VQRTSHNAQPHLAGVRSVVRSCSSQCSQSSTMTGVVAPVESAAALCNKLFQELQNSVIDDAYQHPRPGATGSVIGGAQKW
jgi:hypothetical protein